MSSTSKQTYTLLCALWTGELDIKIEQTTLRKKHTLAFIIVRQFANVAKPVMDATLTSSNTVLTSDSKLHFSFLSIAYRSIP